MILLRGAAKARQDFTNHIRMRFIPRRETSVEADMLDGVFSVYYLCTSRRQHEICFLLKLHDGKVSKVGQSPSPFEFTDDVPVSLRQALGRELDIYRNGLMNESVGIGVGNLLTTDALWRTVVKDLLPDRLKVNGSNPLPEIYSILSIGIHSLNNEECLGYASALRTVFVRLVEDLYYAQNRTKDYTAALVKLKKT